MADDVIAAARTAESALWRHYGLTVSERMIEAGPSRVKVRVLECGDSSGRPLVFVQGGLGEAFGWASLMAKLKDFRCITLDRPGGGLSDTVDFGEVDVSKLAVDVLAAVLDAAGVRGAPFIANSMGGWWTLQLALAMPHRVSRLMLLGCPALLLDTAAPFPMRLMSVPLLGNVMVKSMSPESPEKARATPTLLGHPKEIGERWPDVDAETFYRFGRLPGFQRAWLTLIRRFLRLSGANRALRIGEDALRRLSQPTLFAWGKADPFGSVDSGRAATALMPKAQLHVVGTGHLPWWDDADECARLIRGFLG